MNIKEQIKKIMEQSYYYTDDNSKNRNIDQILDLVLNSLTIEKKDPFRNKMSFEGRMEYAEEVGWDKCVDQLEALKAELRM